MNVVSFEPRPERELPEIGQVWHEPARQPRRAWAEYTVSDVQAFDDGVKVFTVSQFGRHGMWPLQTFVSVMRRGPIPA